MVYPIIKVTWMSILKALLIKKIGGLTNIPKKGPVILAINHASLLDAPLIYSVVIPFINRKIYSPAKKSLFKSKIGDLIFRKWMASVPVNGSVEKLVELLKKGEVVCIFPEGGRSFDGELGKAKTGVAVLALLSGSPVIPIGIKGTFKLWPRGKRFPNVRRRVEIKIGKPIYFKGKYKKRINKKVLEKNTRVVMLKIAKLIGKKYEY